MKLSEEKIIALIPARSGSKRVKNKNIRLLGGKPLIVHTIEAAARVKRIDRVIVSTDSEEIAHIAKQSGAEVPFLRPKEISTADSTEYQFHMHALTWLKEHESYEPDYIVNLYPTTPFRSSDSIRSAVTMITDDNRADSLRSVRKCTEHPYKMWKKNGNYLDRFIRANNSSTQTMSYHLLPEVMIQNASIYIVKKKTLLKYKNTIGKKVLCFDMDEIESIDINYPIDFEFAEFILRNRRIKQKFK